MRGLAFRIRLKKLYIKGEDEMEVEQRLKELIASTGEFIAVDKIDENTDMVQDFGFSSIEIIQLIVMIEDEFEFEFDDDELVVEKIAKYKDLVEIIKDKLN